MFRTVRLALGLIMPAVPALAAEPPMILRPVAPITLAAELRHAAVLKQRQDHRTPRQAGGGTHQAVEVATALDLFLATEIADDPLPGPGPLADGLDQVDVGVRTDALFADEHAPSIRHLCVVSSKQTHQAV